MIVLATSRCAPALCRATAPVREAIRALDYHSARVIGAYPSQRSTPYVDATIDFDLRSAVSSSGPPKMQPRWLSAAYGSFVNKKGTNYQIQMGVIFRYDRCPELRQVNALDLVASAWLACKPLVDLTR